MSTKKTLIVTLIMILTISAQYQSVHAQNAFTWADFLKLIENHKSIDVSYDIQRHIGNNTQFCQASISIPNYSSLEKLVGVTQDQLWEIGYIGSSVFGSKGYFFSVPMEYCSGNGGGGGGSSFQYAANYVWLLVFMAILAAITVSRTRPRLIPG